MSLKADNRSMIRSKHLKNSQFAVDMLAVYRSETEEPVPLEYSLNSLKDLFSTKTPPKIVGCTLQVWHRQNGSIYLVFKSKDKKTILEQVSLSAVGTPTCSQINIGYFTAQSLVFLPVLNSNRKSELFIFHPISVSAQEVVIRIAKLQSFQRSESGTYRSLNGNINLPKLKDSQMEPLKNGINEGDTLSNVSSNFINNWYGKLDSIEAFHPHSSSSIASVNDELSTLNRNLKEIREFMNKIFQIINFAVQQKRKLQQKYSSEKSNGTPSPFINLPSKPHFIEIVEKIKLCLNLAAVHEDIIVNPPSEKIINQLFLFLRILGDATINHYTGHPDLVASVKTPSINSITVKFFTNHLNKENMKFWCLLGHNFGHLRDGNFDRIVFDEFEVRKTLQISETLPRYRSLQIPQILENDKQINQSSFSKNYEIGHLSASPTSFVDNDFLYPSFPRISRTEKKSPLSIESQNPQNQNPAFLYIHPNRHIPTNTSTWHERQNRFIDAVQLRNGKLGKANCDRSSQDYNEIGVSCNEFVEIVKEYGNKYTVKNALGEMGDCPKSIINVATNIQCHH